MINNITPAEIRPGDRIFIERKDGSRLVVSASRKPTLYKHTWRMYAKHDQRGLIWISGKDVATFRRD